jgi:hypothetical protein
VNNGIYKHTQGAGGRIAMGSTETPEQRIAGNILQGAIRRSKAVIKDVSEHMTSAVPLKKRKVGGTSTYIKPEWKTRVEPNASVTPRAPPVPL